MGFPFVDVFGSGRVSVDSEHETSKRAKRKKIVKVFIFANDRLFFESVIRWEESAKEYLKVKHAFIRGGG